MVMVQTRPDANAEDIRIIERRLWLWKYFADCEARALEGSLLVVDSPKMGNVKRPVT